MSKASNLAGFVTSILPPSNLTVGVITATSFVGSGAGLTGVSGIATNTSINTSGIVTASSFVGNVSGNVTGNVTGNLTGTASTATAAATAFGLSGSPNVTVGVLTATSTQVGSAVTINSSGLNITGVVTATSYGGSGANLTSLNASSLSSGTVATARLASGTANSSTFLRGDQTWAAAGGGFANMQVFTSPGTFTVPPTTTKVKVTATGGGVFAPGPTIGGGAGGTGISIINVPSGSSIPVVVGSISPPSYQGGTSTFGSYVSATGGFYSNGGTATFPDSPTSYQAYLAVNGGTGAPGNPSFSVGALGGISYWGGPGSTGPGGARSAFGSGGGVGVGGGPTYFASDGVVVVEW